MPATSTTDLVQRLEKLGVLPRSNPVMFQPPLPPRLNPIQGSLPSHGDQGVTQQQKANVPDLVQELEALGFKPRSRRTCHCQALGGSVRIPVRCMSALLMIGLMEYLPLTMIQHNTLPRQRDHGR